MDKDLTFIKHILENIDRIEKFSKDITKEEFSKNEEKQYAIVRAIEIIGEAVKNLSPSFKQNHKEIEWTKIAGTRDIIIHRYFGLDKNLIWQIIEENLPILKNKLKKLV